MAAATIVLEPDDRGRVNLNRVPGQIASKYIAERNADGSIVLWPAALLTERALESYVQARISHATRPNDAPLLMLNEVLAKHGVQPPTPARVEEVRARLAGAEKAGRRTLADVMAERFPDTTVPSSTTS
jgi:hypothetical protein